MHKQATASVSWKFVTHAITVLDRIFVMELNIKGARVANVFRTLYLMASLDKKERSYVPGYEQKHRYYPI